MTSVYAICNDRQAYVVNIIQYLSLLIISSITCKDSLYKKQRLIKLKIRKTDIYSMNWYRSLAWLKKKTDSEMCRDFFFSDTNANVVARNSSLAQRSTITCQYTPVKGTLSANFVISPTLVWRLWRITYGYIQMTGDIDATFVGRRLYRIAA